ncbi:FidL-like protein [Citrobacter meridianamericanus]|uniref:FidL-like protein n=1 Tax=Citrobacter meridianamericanus TaxID=2894201 RepID=A0ABT1BGS4_9ENTR|nr:FidL-like protein [Citrobacter meridianamericanus]MCO5784641.1 FidL-like protein [Citrobacter meridianamericanus]
MKKIVISLFIVLVLSGGTLWLARYMSGTELDCRSTFEKNTSTGLIIRGNITVHLFRDHTGVGSMSGKMIAPEGVYILNRETVFNYERIDAQKGVYRINRTLFRILSRDTLPARYNNDIDMNTESRSSDYMMIRKINKNTVLFSSPAAPTMICVTE